MTKWSNRDVTFDASGAGYYRDWSSESLSVSEGEKVAILETEDVNNFNERENLPEIDDVTTKSGTVAHALLQAI